MADYSFQGLLNALTQQESQWDPNARSDAGAIGLTQLKPETAMDPGYGARNLFDIAEGYGFDVSDQSKRIASSLLADPEVNYMTGANYLSALLRRFGGDVDRALAGYNWGPSEAADWSGRMSDLPGETQSYIKKIREYYKEQTGTALPRRGSYSDLVYSERPRPRPHGLLE